MSGSGSSHTRWIVASCLAVFVIVAASEFYMGRLGLGPDGRFGWWESNIWSNEQSQRFADPYSFTHIVHGFMFYGLLWLLARRVPVRYRFVAAVVLEGAWEILENSPIIINRYREVTISLGYTGDSVLNSLSDILMMATGFLVASRIKLWQSLVAVAVMEVGLLFWVRDNLTLNMLMLIHPIDAIKAWQSAGHT